MAGPVQRGVSQQLAGLPQPYYQDEAVTLYHGDALALMPLLPKADASPRRTTMQCKTCGSFAINYHDHGRDGSDTDLCDVCYWRKRADDAELIASQAKRLALELECLLNDTKGTAVQSKWWDSAYEALQLYLDACSVAYQEAA